MTHLNRLLAIAAAVTGLLADAQPVGAEPAVSPLGQWRTIDDATGKPRSIIRLDVADGMLQGRIEKSLDPRDKPDAKCEKCPGTRKDQPIIGMAILTGLRPVAGDPMAWEGGEILDPDSGSVYRARMRLMPGGAALELRGFVGVPMLGRTQTWQRVE